MEKVNRKVSIILLVVILLIGAFVALIGFIADFMWFREMGYLSVFFKQLVTQLTVGIPTFLVITVLVFLYLSMLKKGYFSQIASSEMTDMKKLRRTTLLLSVAFGIFATVMTVWQLWLDILKFANSTDFDISDPLFGFDISFYIFKLDFLTQMNEILIGIIIGFVALTALYYIILMTVRTPDVFKKTSTAKLIRAAAQTPDRDAAARPERETCSASLPKRLPARGTKGRSERRNSSTTAISSS